MKTFFVFFISLLFVLATSDVKSDVIKISANRVIYNSFHKLTDEKKCFEVNDFTEMNTHRGVIELILICKALHRGGLSPDIQLKEVPNYSRALVEATKGNVTMPAETAWNVEINQSDFYVTEPIFAKGSIELGIYALPSNKSIMKINSVKELKNYKAVSSDRWVVDWSTLNAMGINVHCVPKLHLMFKFIAAGRADFVLNEFSSKEDFSMKIAGVRLIPVPNIKIALDGSRHFVVSRNAPNAENVFKALQKGLSELRQESAISRAFKESGIVNSRVKDWQLIYP